MTPEGNCPSCGRSLDDQAPRLTARTVDVKRLAAGDDPDDAKAPWHFKVLMVLLAAYLGWRVVDLFL